MRIMRSVLPAKLPRIIFILALCFVVIFPFESVSRGSNKYIKGTTATAFSDEELLQGIAAFKAWQAEQEVREFYEWVDYASRAHDAVNANRPLPATPTSSFVTETILKRLDGLATLVNSLKPPPDPNVPVLERTPDLPQKMREFLSTYETHIQNLEARKEFFATVKAEIDKLRDNCLRADAQLRKLIEAGVPDPTRSITAAWHDVNTTIPKATVPVLDAVREQDRTYEGTIKLRREKYQAWDALARRIAESYNYEEEQRRMRESLKQARRAAMDGSKYVRGPQSDRGGRGGYKVNTKIEATTSRLEVSAINSLPKGVVEHWIIPSKLSISRPAELQPIVVPPGATIMIMAAFPSSDEVKLDISFLNEQGAERGGNIWGGKCGGKGFRRFTNETDDLLTVRVSATYESGDRSGNRVPLSSYHVFNEVAVMGWGYRPPPSTSAGQGPNPHSAVLTVARVDEPSTVYNGKGYGGDEGRISVGSPTEVDHSMFILGFGNDSTQVNFRERKANGNTSPFWGKFFGSPNHLETNILRTNSRSTVDFTASVLSDDGNLRPISWYVKQLNPEMYLAGAGFRPAEYPDLNSPHKAVMLVVHMGCTPSLEE